MRIEWVRAMIGGVVLLLGVLALLVPVLEVLIFPLPDRYISIHSSQPLEPLLGFADDSIFNVGSAKELDALPGIGAVLSQRIIDARDIWGDYRLPTDLLLVKGIGVKTLQGMMDALTEELVPLTE